MMFSLTALLCPLLALAFIVAIIVLIARTAVRTMSNVTGGGAKPLNVITQLGPDGFWLSSFEPSSVIYYDYWAAGAKQAGQIVYQPGSDGRQFVYTGVRPEQVAIVRVEGPSGGVTSGIPPTIEDASPDIAGPI